MRQGLDVLGLLYCSHWGTELCFCHALLWLASLTYTTWCVTCLSGNSVLHSSLLGVVIDWLHLHFSLSWIGEGNGNPLQCSCLENPRDGGVWWAAVYGVAQSWTRLKRLSSSSSTGYLVPLQLTWKTCFLSMSPGTGRQILNLGAARKVPTSYIRIGVKIQKGELPGGPVVRTSHSNCQGPWDQSLVEELRSHKPQGVAKKIQKERNI